MARGHFDIILFKNDCCLTVCLQNADLPRRMIWMANRSWRKIVPVPDYRMPAKARIFAKKFTR